MGCHELFWSNCPAIEIVRPRALPRPQGHRELRGRLRLQHSSSLSQNVILKNRFAWPASLRDSVEQDSRTLNARRTVHVEAGLPAPPGSYSFYVIVGRPLWRSSGKPQPPPIGIPTLRWERAVHTSTPASSIRSACLCSAEGCPTHGVRVSSPMANTYPRVKNMAPLMRALLEHAPTCLLILVLMTFSSVTDRLGLPRDSWLAIQWMNIAPGAQTSAEAVPGPVRLA